jgi:hypothetical protein
MATTRVKEYFLQFWGGAEETIENELGIMERNFWFPNERSRKDFEAQLEQFAGLGLAMRKEEGVMTHARTIAVVTMRYRGHTYVFEQDFGFEYKSSSAVWMFKEGNYACDCNRSMFIQEVNPMFPSLGCGRKIKLLKIRTTLRS